MSDNEWVEQVRRFHETYGQPVAQEPEWLSFERFALRRSLIQEELDELVDEYHSANMVGVADALGDLLVVTIGTAIEFGIPIDQVMRAIYKANMSKLGEDGKPIYREDGKVLKGPNFTPPEAEIEAILEDAGWEDRDA